jgi:hypothetical protein
MTKPLVRCEREDFPIVQNRRKPRTWSATLLAVLVLGLSTAVCGADSIRTLPAVGPSEPEHVGYLIVDTETVPFDDGDVMYYTHTAYNLFTAKGEFLKRVRNRIIRGDEAPQTITLPPGEYLIHAQSEADGTVAVPVIIADGRTTVVNLESHQGPEQHSR